ncbi:glycosyltransferase family 4 protein [Flavobacterium sp. CYK-55]|uniref:glycosyltransferase family 4 protein n=1 Tax=Flavobacterium sp. CYK-55 TaxID=2835529 RepID=UPI001BCE4062|nr:glycosyltransferase family 4 protein [Flavobacterium sp. CYK-55]MBS7787519.1 glycosyltransferase family 4 protein [Flavobacterium sp. CYK-55]
MKIAILTSRYPKPEQPYNHMFVHIRSLYFKSQNQDVTVLVPSSEKTEYIIDDIRVLCDSTSNIANQLDQYDVTYLHLLQLYPFSAADGSIVYDRLKKNNKAFAIYLHGSEVQRYQQYGFDFDWSIKQMIKFFYKNVYVIPKMRRFLIQTQSRPNTIIIFPSLWMKQNAEENLRMKINNYTIIPNGIDTDFFGTPKTIATNPRRLVSIRSFSSKVYNILDSIMVLEKLPKDYTLTIYGEGFLIPYYLRVIKQKNLEERVTIIPKFLDREAMKQVFLSYDLFISTTLFDSQGVTMLEAMSSGLLVAAYDNSSRKEFIKDNVTGILGRDVIDLANKIVHITQQQEVFNAIISNGQEYIKQINVPVVGNLELKQLKKIVNQ